ncbi:dirigent protein 23-like [Humulus lupulus]|uniref:dirigent protein 23-like n=1 Tax=Humulus lupulus TaxID=3486 RepID=UPI002B415BFD|nr:dirigent protein 23-like [Humulus lupulus]
MSSMANFFITFVAAVWVCTTEAAKPNLTNIQFYMHDVVGGPNATAVQVASRLTNYTGSDPIATMLGSIYVMDNPLTATPEPNSTLVGRAQGMYVISSQHNEFSLHMTLTYVLAADGPYNRSTFSVVGRNPVMNDVREMPVVGGTGMFRLARGYCFAKTHSTDQMDAIIGYNVTLLHEQS